MKTIKNFDDFNEGLTHLPYFQIKDRVKLIKGEPKSGGNSTYTEELKTKKGKVGTVLYQTRTSVTVMFDGDKAPYMIDKKQLELSESVVNEAALPSNISDWLKRQATQEQASSAKKVANWADKAGTHISGGTTIGKSPQTLILDIKHQGSEIYIDDEGKIEFNGEEIATPKEFATAFDSYKKSSDENKKYFKVTESNLSEATDKELNIKLWNAFTNLVDGLDGIISEEGELNTSFWKEDVEKRMESFNEFWGKDKIEMKKKLDSSKLKALIEDMLDGLDGWESEGHSVSKYFKSRKVISDAKKAVGFVNESEVNEAGAGWKFYIGERYNPQLPKPYYKAYGQLSKADVKRKEDTVYGGMTLTGYDTEAEYNEALDKIKKDGFSIR